MKKITNNNLKLRTKKAGLPPGTPVYIGEVTENESQISVIKYNTETIETYNDITKDELIEMDLQDQNFIYWVNIEGINDIDLVEVMGYIYGIHPLTLEDICNTDQRPKVESYENYDYITLKMIYYDESEGQATTEQVSIVLGSNFLISFQEAPGDIFDNVRDRLNNSQARIRKLNSDYLAYSLMDAVVDAYFYTLEKISEKLEFLDDMLEGNYTSSEVLKLIDGVRRELLFLRKSTWPLREEINIMIKGDSKFISKDTILYLRDVYDHTVEVMENIEGFRDTISGMLDMNMSILSNKTNETMKFLTLISTIFIPLTFIAGVYGMNFQFMPELGWEFGYPLILLIMIGVALYLINYFKKRKWL